MKIISEEHADEIKPAKEEFKSRFRYRYPTEHVRVHVLAILDKYQNKQWDWVYSEILKKTKEKFPKIIDWVVKRVVKQYVELSPTIIDGTPYVTGLGRRLKPLNPHWFNDVFYVDYSGRLKKAVRSKKPKYKSPVREVKVGNFYYKKENNIWYRYILDQKIIDYGSIFSTDVPVIWVREKKGGNNWTFKSKQQLSKKQLKLMGFTNG